jgi:putative DNA primase/helicase
MAEVISTGKAWTVRRIDLAQWTLERLVNRNDCAGGYKIKNGQIELTTYPWGEDGHCKPRDSFVNQKRLEGHFAATGPLDAVGLHSLGKDSKGKSTGIDLDCHGDTTDDAERNQRFALSIHTELVEIGFRPLIYASNGAGGYHLRVLFTRRLDGATLQAFGQWLIRKWKEFGFSKPPEVFPKQATITATRQFGNWLRLPGKHPRREYWSEVWNGSVWLTDGPAVDLILSLTGDSPDLIPLEALMVEPPAAEVGPTPSTNGQTAAGEPKQPYTGPGPDIYGEFNRSQSMDSMTEILERNGWHRIGDRGNRRDFRRPGKTGGGQSGNLQEVEGTIYFYPFTTATSLTPAKGWTPAALRCRLEHNNDWPKFRAKLKDEGFGAKPKSEGKKPSGPEPETTEVEPGKLIRESFFDSHKLGRLLIPIDAEGLPTIVSHRSEWWQYSDGCYVRASDADFVSRAWIKINAECEASYHRHHAAWELSDKSSKEPTKPTVTTKPVGNAVAAARSMVLIDGNINPPVLLKSMPSGSKIPRLDPVDDGPEYLACANGLIDLRAAIANRGRIQILPRTPLYFTTAAIPVLFDPDKPCRRFLDFLDTATVGDHELKTLVQEMFGYLLRFDTSLQAFFMLSGPAGAGKSSLLAIVHALLGNHNISSVPLEQFGERFQLTATLGKLVNSIREVGELDKVAEAALKAFTDGSPMLFDRKNKEPLNTRPTARLVLSCNTPPRFADRSDGVWRRMILLPFIAQGFQIVRGMDEPSFWESELSGILNWALEGMRSLYRKGEFTVGRASSAEKENQKEMCNPHRSFLSDHATVYSEGHLPCSELYREYKRWCIEKGYRPLSDGHFGAEVYRIFRVRRSRLGGDGHRIYAYVGIAWDSNRPREETG